MKNLFPAAVFRSFAGSARFPLRPIALLLLSGLSLPVRAAPLTLREYLDQVQSGSPAVRSSIETIEGTSGSAKESELVTMPRFFVSGSRTTDRRQFYIPFMGGRTTADNFNFGLEKQFTFGLSAKLSYNLLNNQTSNLPANIFPGGVNNYSAAQSQLDFTQSLWKNFFGKETRATADLAEASSLAAHFGERFKLKQTLAQAESAYHRVAIANESVRLETELLERSQKILDWTTRRVNNHLADRIDLLQSRASLQARRISLENAKNELRSAALGFNQYRNLVSEEVPEAVSIPATGEILSLPVPSRAEDTDDLKAAGQSERIARANNEIALQKTLPDVSAFGTVAFNGQSGLQSQAMSNALTTNFPYTVFGLKLSVPLGLGDASDIRAGRVKQQLAAEQTTRQKTLESTQAFSDLSRKFNEAKERLRMADELVNLQKEKLEYEKYRFSLGRTTTYQVLTFEQDYAQSLIARLQVEREILTLHAQLKPYSAE